MARTNPNREMRLIENPRSFIMRKVPIRETGIVTDGMMVDLQSCRKINRVNTTNRMAISRVITTSLIEAEMNWVVSRGTPY